MSAERPNTERKALSINLDPRRYGSFAEIGAGQEVVRWFFRVGGAAGTIAKSMSAYDMSVSDAIYGHCDRYVCRQRLEDMLEHEHSLNLERLRESRGDTTAFFVFADTVSARNFKGTNDCHGWMGVRFQAHPRDQDSQIIVHVRMLDTENALQQEALGIVGVNLLYGAFFLNHEPEQLIESLLDNLSTRRIEIDMIEFSGIAFRHVDNRVMSLRLVQLGLSNAAMFSAKGEVLQPSEVLYKKPILVERGSFRPLTNVNVDMLSAAREGVIAVLGLAPALVALSGSELAAYHAVEHKAIAGYEQDKPPADVPKEHQRCGSNLIAPMILFSLAGQILLQRLVENPGRLAQAGSGLAGLSLSVETFVHAEKHPGSPLGRAVHASGDAIQRLLATREPTEEQLEVGVAALAAALEAESS